MAEIDRLTVVIDANIRPLSSAFSRAIRETKAFGGQVSDIGAQADKSAARGSKAFDRFGRTIRGVQTDLKKGGQFDVKTDFTWAQALGRAIAGARSNLGRGGRFNVNVNRDALGAVLSEANNVRQNLSNGADFNVRTNQQGITEANRAIEALRMNAHDGGIFNIIADMSGIAGMTSEIEAVRANANRGATFNVDGDFDTSRLLPAFNDINQRYVGLNGRRITMYGGVDTSLAQALPNALGSIEQQVMQSQLAMQTMAVVHLPMMLAGMAGLAGGAAAAGVAVGSLAIQVGSGLVGVLGAAGTAAVTAGGGLAGIGVSALSAIGNVLGLKNGMGTFSASAKVAKDEVKLFEEQLAMMPAGTEAAYQAQDRLRLAMEHQAAVTQMTIDWWGKYGAAANEAAAELNVLREGILRIVTDTGGKMLPIIEDFAEIANSHLPNVAAAFDMLAAGAAEGTAELRTYLESAQGFQAVQDILLAMGDAGGAALNILSNGFIIVLEVIQEMLPQAEQMLTFFSSLAREAAVWVQTAQGQEQIALIWAEMTRAGETLVSIAANIAAGFYGIGVALASTGIGQDALTGIENLSYQFRELMSATGEGRQAIIDFAAEARPALEAIVPAALQWGEAFLQVVDSIFKVRDATGEMSAMEAIIISIGNAADEFAYIFTHEWEAIAPMIPPLIDALVDFAETFVPATAEMQVFIPLLTDMLEAFNSLPEPMQVAIARTLAWGTALNTLTGGALGGAVGALTNFLGLWGGVALMSRAVPGMNTIPGPLSTITKGLWAASKAAGAFLLKWGPLAALAAITIDVIVNWPDMQSAYETQYAEARAGGEGYSRSFLEGLKAAIGETEILSWVQEITQWFKDSIAGLREGPSLWDALVGDATFSEWWASFSGEIDWAAIGTSLLEGAANILPGGGLLAAILGGGSEESGENPLITTIQGYWDSAMEWLGGLVPDVNLMDVLMGAVESGGDMVTSITTALGEMWTAATEWLAGLVPETSLIDVLMGLSEFGGDIVGMITAKLGEMWQGAVEWLANLQPGISIWDVLAGQADMQDQPLLALLEDAWIAVTEWLANLVPETSLMDVLLGNGEAEDNPLLSMLITAWEGVTEWLASLVVENSLLDVLLGGANAEDNPLLNFLITAWEGVVEWIGGLMPEVSLLDVLLGNAEAEENPLLNWLITAWEGVVEWLGGLVPDVTLMDVLLGIGEGVESLLEPVISFFETLYNDYFLYYFGSDGVIATAVSDFFSYLLDNYWTPYFGTDGTLVTAVSDFFTSLYETYWLPYFGTDGTLLTGLSDFFTYLMETYWTPYFGTDGTILTAVSDFFTYLYETYWLPYFGTDGTLLTAISDFFTYLMETYWTPYFGTDGTILTAVSDFFTYLYETYWLPYFGTDGTLMTAIADFFTYLIENYWDPYFGTEGTLVTGVQTAWDAIVEGVGSFVDAFFEAIGPLADHIDTALGWLQSLADGLDYVLEAIGAPTLDISIPLIGGSDAYHGASTDEMATGGMRGGQGYKGAHPQVITWDEQHNGREWWIATGDPNKRRQRKLLAGAAHDLGVDMAGGQGMNFPGQSNAPGMAHGGSLPGVPIFRNMAIGGGTDVGPEGLTGLAAEIANMTMSTWGVWANTYTGGEFPHGSLHGNTPENTWDIWNDSGFGALDVATGDEILSTYLSAYGDQLDTVIWQGVGEGPAGPFDDGDHYDHLHASVGGTGIYGAAGAIAARLLQIAKSAWESVMSSIGEMPILGDEPFYQGVMEFAGTLPDLVWEYILSKVPRGSGGWSSALGALTGSLGDMVNQAIEAAGWGADELAALQTLWGEESGWDSNAVNPESGAYGIPQINPASWGYPVPLGDDASQIAWGIDYITERYGSPSAALDFWLANNWYHKGGVIPGPPGADRLVQAEAGERILSRADNKTYEAALENTVSMWRAGGGAGAGAGADIDSDSAGYLQAIYEALEYGNNNPTPVKVDNTDDFKSGFVAGALAAIKSDAGADIMDDHLSEGVEAIRDLMGRPT
jgi:hypothetical protein